MQIGGTVIGEMPAGTFGMCIAPFGTWTGLGPPASWRRFKEVGIRTRRTRWLFALAVLALAVGTGGCGEDPDAVSPSVTTTAGVTTTAVSVGAVLDQVTIEMHYDPG